ncbi:MAG: hypothetical protein ACAH59_03170 [Pseudobdellovibrionaceae bacterium]
MKIFCLLFPLALALPAAAQWTMKPQGGLGFTNNANFEETDKDADGFWWVRSSNLLIENRKTSMIWLNYRDYLKEHQNDVFSYRLGQTHELGVRGLGSFDWDYALGGQYYSEGSPATTEESFNYTFLSTSLAKSFNPNSRMEVVLEPTYEIKFFHQFEGRVDHSLIFNSLLDWTLTPTQTLAPYAEIGLVFSSQSLYSKNYLEFGGEWRIHPQPDLSYGLHFLSRFSSYPHRKISESTVISNKKGRPVSTSQTEIETQTLFQLQGTVAKMFERTELAGSLALNSQSSRSGFENFQEIQGWIRLTVPFESGNRRP